MHELVSVVTVKYVTFIHDNNLMQLKILKY